MAAAPAAAIGSGGGYAEAAARALLGVEGSTLDAMGVARKAMRIAADCCVYTNHEVSWELLPVPEGGTGSGTASAAPGASVQAQGAA